MDEEGSEDTGLLHHAGAGVREDQRGVSEGCAGVWIVDISKNNNHNATMMDYCYIAGSCPDTNIFSRTDTDNLS
jgi:hypothetical protein